MNLSLTELKQKGAVVSPDLIVKKLEWKRRNDDGEIEAFNFEIGILPYTVRMVEILSNMPDGDEESRTAYAISKMIRFGDGTEQLTYEEAKLLDPTFSDVLSDGLSDFIKEARSKKV